MIWALIRKDARLLRHYLGSAFAATLACYLASIIMVVILTHYQDSSTQSFYNRALLVCMGGSNCGLPTTYFFAALLAGSVFTLERSDRSAEFLACLPPTRTQNLVSKLTIVLGTTTLMIMVHLFFVWASHLLLPFVREQSTYVTQERLTNPLAAFSFVSMIIATIGLAFAVSAWMKSNGVPILCGLLAPVLIVSLVSLLGWALEIPSEGDAFVIRFITTAFVLGLAFGLMGCYWYLSRNEP